MSRGTKTPEVSSGLFVLFLLYDTAQSTVSRPTAELRFVVLNNELLFHRFMDSSAQMTFV